MLKGGTFRPHAKMFECHEHTVRATIKRWSSSGLSGLWEADGRGAKRRWSDEDMEYIETCLKDRTPTYNSLQLSRKLTQARAVNLSSDRLREILKKKNYRWKRTRHSHRKKQDRIKGATLQADLDMLELAEAVGEIELKYLDE
jgi:transposase